METMCLYPRTCAESRQKHPILSEDVEKVSQGKMEVFLFRADVLSTEEPSSNLDNYFLVPQQRVKDFIPRDDLLDKIRSHFSGDQTGSPPNLILYALGGQGKSQIVLEYCRKWQDTYRGVFWIDANSKATVTQSYGTIAAKLFGESQTETGDSAVQTKMVKGHLERWSEAWLLLFDNYDGPEKFPEIKDFIPISKRYSFVNG